MAAEDWSAWAPQLRNVEKLLRYRRCGAVRQLMQGADPLLVCSARDPQNELIHVYFLRENKVGVKTLRRLHAECAAAGCGRVLLVTEDGLTPFATKELEETGRGARPAVEVFRRRELAFCVVEHCLVPPHEQLEPAERRALLQQPGFKPGTLPRLRAADPVARFMGFQPGAVVRIRRAIGTSDGELYYRIVVA